MEEKKKPTEPKPFDDVNNNMGNANTNMDEGLQEMTDEQKQRFEELEKKLADTEAKLKQASSYHYMYYRQAGVLKKALKAIMEANGMKLGDIYETLLEANDIDLDGLLNYLSK